MCIYICQKWLSTFKTWKDLYHKPHEEGSLQKKKKRQYLMSCLIFFKVQRHFFSFCMKTMHHNNHKRSVKKYLHTVSWHLKEDDLSHSQGWPSMLFGLLSAGFLSMSCYLLVSQNPPCQREASVIHHHQTSHPRKAKKRDFQMKCDMQVTR